MDEEICYSTGWPGNFIAVILMNIIPWSSSQHLHRKRDLAFFQHFGQTMSRVFVGPHGMFDASALLQYQSWCGSLAGTLKASSI